MSTSEVVEAVRTDTDRSGGRWRWSRSLRENGGECRSGGRIAQPQRASGHPARQ